MKKTDEEMIAAINRIVDAANGDSDTFNNVVNEFLNVKPRKVRAKKEKPLRARRGIGSY